MKKYLIILPAILLLTACSRDEGKNIVAINGKEIKVEIAATPAEHYKGLSGRENLCENCGMLFKFADKRKRTFVMRKMNFPLDIIWIDGGKVAGVSENLPPEGERYRNFYESPSPVDYVLEVNAGFARENGVKIGDTVDFSL